MAGRRKQYSCRICDSRRVIIDKITRIEEDGVVGDLIWICEDCDYIGYIDAGDTPKGW
jgi:hypothetical protein